MKIPIIAGHTISSPGAIAYNGETEHSYNVDLQNLIVSKQQAAISLTGSSMVPVTDNEELCLRSVINLINNTRCAAYGLDIHFNNNNPQATGIEVFIHPNTTANNRMRADYMVKGLANIMRIRNRGVKHPAQSARKRLAIIEETNIPMILVEVCFLNMNDLRHYYPNKYKVAKFLQSLMFSATGFPQNQ